MTKIAIVIFTVALVCCSIGIRADSDSNTNSNDNGEAFSDGFQKMGDQMASEFQDFNPLNHFSSFSSSLSKMLTTKNGEPVVDQIAGYTRSNVNGKTEEHEFHN